MKKLNYFSLFILLLVIFNFSGCGYTTTAYIGPHKTIYIESFKNSINIASAKSEYSQYINYYPLLESTITKKVVDRFIFDGSLKVVRSPEKADLIIRGELVSYDRDALRYADNNEDVDEYRITLFVNLELYNNVKKERSWKQDNFAGDSTYFTTGSEAKSEKSALDAAIADLARRVVEAVVEAW